MVSEVLWIMAGGVPLLLPLVWELYGGPLHPAWRRERRILQACEKTFGEGHYRLERLYARPETPSSSDLLPPPLGTADPFSYFVYSVEVDAAGGPDLSGANQKDRDLLRRCLSRSFEDVPHNDREVLRGAETGTRAEADVQPSASPTIAD